MNDTLVAAAMLLVLTFATGCSVGSADDEATGASQDELISTNTCSAGTWKGNSLRATVRFDRWSSDDMQFYFEGAHYTEKNNAFVTQVHADGSWILYRTDDNIHDRAWTTSNLHRVSSSKGNVSTARGLGDVYRVQVIFDLPGARDMACTTLVSW